MPSPVPFPAGRPGQARREPGARTRVYLTIDVECAEERIVAGRFQPAMGYDVRVFGRLTNQRVPLGIERIFGEWEACGHRATCFVEPLGAESFGREGLREACQLIRDRGHDVQLHAHPSQLDAHWHSCGHVRPPDDMSAYSQQEQAALMNRGIELLADCGVPPSSVVSFRAGNFGANNATWRAMADVGLLVSSSYNLGYRHKSVFDWPAQPVTLFRAEAGIWELPMAVFRQPFGRGYRHLQLKAVSSSEIEWTLNECWRRGVPHLVLLTHSFEFLHLDYVAKRQGRPNTVALRRLSRLGRFLQGHSDRFQVSTVAELAEQLRGASPADPAWLGQVPRESASQHVRRLLEQTYQRLQVRWPVP